MQTKSMVAIKSVSLVLSILVTTVTFMKLADLQLEFGLFVFVIWIVSPYVCFFLATYLLERFTSIPQISRIGFVIALLMLGFTILTYGSLFNVEEHSSTEGLVFVFIPLWLFIGSFALLGLGVLVAWLSNRQPKKTP